MQAGGEGMGRDQMSFFNEPWPPLDFVDVFDSIHGYEGVFVPGGSLTVGHWVDMRPNDLETGYTPTWITVGLRI
jgi:hypothetical protein